MEITPDIISVHIAMYEISTDQSPTDSNNYVATCIENFQLHKAMQTAKNFTGAYTAIRIHLRKEIDIHPIIIDQLV